MEHERLVKVLFRGYYSSIDISIRDLELREFGFAMSDGVMVRHMSFRNPEELRNFLTSKVPMHAYHSVAIYREPGNSDMELKGWLGADLVFDIDGDHLSTPNCSGIDLMTLDCLGDALEELNRLLDILKEEFGIEDPEVYFSGHRGFHVHVTNTEVRPLGQRERGEIVDYLLLRNFRMERFLRSKVRLSIDMAGTGGRIARALHEEGGRGRKIPVEKLKVSIDEVVTLDTHRLIRMPNSLHGKTGLRVVKLTPSELERGVEYVVDKAIVFRKGSITMRLTRKLPMRRILGEPVDGDEVVKVPTYLGIYLLMSGWGELIDR